MILAIGFVLIFIIVGKLVLDSKRRDSVEVELKIPFMFFAFKSKNEENSGGHQSNRKKNK